MLLVDHADLAALKDPHPYVRAAAVEAGRKQAYPRSLGIA